MSSVGDKLSDRGESSSRKRSRVVENDDNNHYKLDVVVDDDNDLKVTVGSIKEKEKKKKKSKKKDDSPKGTDEGNGDGEGQQMKEYRYQSKVLSFYSGYIRRLLSSPMKESTTKELTFPDIIPSTWELMIDLLTNPIRVRHMSPYDALDVLPFYDKYDFTKGITLCDDVLSDFIRRHIEDKDKNTQQQHEDILVDAISLAHKLKLDNTCIQGFMYIDRIVSGYPKFPMRWTVNHVKKLVPVLASNTLIQDSMRRRLHMKEEELDREFIESSAFPNYFVAQYQLIAARRTTGNIINKIMVSNCGLGSGIYKESSDCTKKSVSCYTFMPADPELWEGNIRVHSYEIVKHEGQEWKIVAWVPNPGIPGLFISKHLCTCEGSRYSILPPNTGWEKTKSGRMPELNYFCVDGKNVVEIAANL